MNLEELRDAKNAAENAESRHNYARRTFIDAAARRAFEQAEHAWDEIEADTSLRLRRERRATYEAHCAEEERLARAKGATVSTEKLYEWKGDRWDSKKFELTGRVAVREVITLSSEHPGNLSQWGRADLGQQVLRIIKKDGKPGSLYLKVAERDWNFRYWQPVGHSPLTPAPGRGEA